MKRSQWRVGCEVPILTKETGTRVKHPDVRALQCLFDEENGMIQIQDHGHITTLLVPPGKIEVVYDN